MLKFFMCFLLLTSVSFARHDRRLGEVLSQQEKTFTQKMPKEVVELYQDNIKGMKEAGIHKKALKVGDKVPEAKIKLNGTEVPLSQIYGRGPLVLKFYRGGWCPYCITELKYYDEMYAEFQKAKAQIIALSPDTEQMSGKTKSTHELSFDVISDPNHQLAHKFNLVYKLDSKVADQLKKSGVELEAFQGNNSQELAIPATYVIDKDGRIAFSYVDVDYKKRAEPVIVLKAVKALKK